MASKKSTHENQNTNQPAKTRDKISTKLSTRTNQNHSSTKSPNLSIINQIQIIRIYKELPTDNSSEITGKVSHGPSFVQSPKKAPQATGNRLDPSEVPLEVSPGSDGVDP
jgi:hypothetical protein